MSQIAEFFVFVPNIRQVIVEGRVPFAIPIDLALKRILIVSPHVLFENTREHGDYIRVRVAAHRVQMLVHEIVGESVGEKRVRTRKHSLEMIGRHRIDANHENIRFCSILVETVATRVEMDSIEIGVGVRQVCAHEFVASTTVFCARLDQIGHVVGHDVEHTIEYLGVTKTLAKYIKLV